MADFVLAAMQPYFSQKFYNPSSPYAPAVEVRREYETAKGKIAASFGARADDCIITAGATESINLAFGHVTRHVVTSIVEHPAVLEAAKRHDHTLIEVDDKARVAPEAITTALQPDTELVSIVLANNELGTIQPLRKIAAIIEAERQARREQGNPTPLLFHADGSQGFGQIDVHVARLGVDMLTLNAGKMYGPKQVGVLWTRHAATLKPLIVGGGQEFGVRSGTENVAGVAGFAAAITHAVAKQPAENKRLSALRDHLEKRLLRAFPEAKILGDPKHRLPGHLAIAFGGIDAERIIFMLEPHILIASGSACSANKHTASHVLRAIKLDDDFLQGNLRLTLGRTTTEPQVNRAADAIINALSSEYARMKNK